MLSKKILILPVFNEEENILEVLGNLALSPDTHILVVDDGSTDNTREILSMAKMDFLIQHPQNQGYGKSLLDGFGFAVKNNYKYALTMDCDGQHEPAYIPEFFEKLKEFDIASGSRYLPESPRVSDPPKGRLKINRTITQLICQCTGYNITDSFCGFKGYRVSALKKLKLTEPGYGMPLQLWIQAWQAGLKIKEIPVPLIYKCWDRAFKGVFKSTQQRLKYYLEVIERENGKHLSRGCPS